MYAVFDYMIYFYQTQFSSLKLLAMCTLKCLNAFEGILVYDQKDTICINLKHNMKVYFKLDDSIMVKNVRDNNCIAVAGEVESDKTRMFSLHREDINVHHNAIDCLSVEIINAKGPSINKL